VKIVVRPRAISVEFNIKATTVATMAQPFARPHFRGQGYFCEVPVGEGSRRLLAEAIVSDELEVTRAEDLTVRK
jgi:hypothetical protein